jgi:two-component system LytT family sensor kinase
VRDVSGSFHLPTAIFVAGAMVLAYALVRLVRHGRQSSQGFVSEVDQATHATLHTASMAARHLQDGLTADGTAKAAKHLRQLLGSSAVAVCDSSGLLAWDGAPEHHAADAPGHAEEVLRTGRTIVLHAGQVQCADPDCPARTVVIAPVVTGDRVVAAIAAYGPHASAGLARATEEVAGWMATQAELSDLGHQRTRTMEAELRALRAQISPHFIYNSLAAIASFVRTDPERARELLLEFADFTRYALRRGGAFTTLAEELRNVERYLVLEQARFGDRLRISLLIAPEVLPVTVPYLAIQPLVENAVRHGLATKEGGGHVTITAQDEGSEAVITIEDDGVGSDPQAIRTVLDGRADGDNVGLGNVDARLRQVYGDDFGLVVETAPGAGTKVTFRVPKYAPGVHPTP